jgi:hypothetical protein
MTGKREHSRDAQDGRRSSPFEWTSDDLTDPQLNPAPGLGSPPGVVPAPYTSAPGEAVTSLTNEAAVEPPPSGQGQPPRSGRLAIVSLMAASVGAIGSGAALWAALSSLDPAVPLHPFGNALHWLGLALVMALLVFVSVVLALVSMIRRSRPGVALLAVAIAFVVAPIAVAIGFEEGANAFKDKASVQAATQVVRTLEKQGVRLGPFGDWLLDGDHGQ